MRAPGFWARPAHPAALLLAPLGAAYGALASARLRRPAPRADLPVIAIGGITAGGDGKTPLALAVAARLMEMGERPAFLTRGYGRGFSARPEGSRSAGARWTASLQARFFSLPPFAVDLARHAPRQTGDEPRLLARTATAIVGADRAAAARLAQSLGATVLILDDGLHSRRLVPDLALLAVDAAYGAGNGLCLPAGPLRAPLEGQFSVADAVVTIGEGEELAARAGKPVLMARLAPCLAAAARLKGARVFAFAGIARPQKFLASMAEVGATVMGTRWFDDHHWFSEADLAALRREAAAVGAALITTEKDAARIVGLVLLRHKEWLETDNALHVSSEAIRRHCERSEAIQSHGSASGLLRCARNDGSRVEREEASAGVFTPAGVCDTGELVAIETLPVRLEFEEMNTLDLLLRKALARDRPPPQPSPASRERGR